jgi:hypothetical protein
MIEVLQTDEFKTWYVAFVEWSREISATPGASGRA